MMKRRARAFTDIYNWAERNQRLLLLQAFTTLEKEGNLTTEQAMAIEIYNEILNIARYNGATDADEAEMMVSL